MENLNAIQNPEPNPRWRVEKIYTDTDLFFEDILRAIGLAQHWVRVEFYIFEKGELSERLFSTFRQAIQRGVKIKLIIDGFGCSEWKAEDLRKLDGQNIQTRIYRPFPWIRKPSQPLSHFLKVHKFGRWFKYLNRRNHRKTVLIDEHALFSGSANLSSKHFKAHQGSRAWRDTGVYVEGAEIFKAIDAFEKAWLRAWNPDFQDTEHLLEDWSVLSIKASRKNLSSLIHLNYYSFLRLFYFYRLLRKIAKAQNKIWITNAYFIPMGRLAHFLKKAKKRGVDIKILIPYKSDHKIAQWVSSLLMWRLARWGIEIYEYLPSILHAKTLIIDNFAMIGSSNLNYRSVRHDLEIDIAVQKAESLALLEKQFLADLQQSKKLSAHQRSFRRFLFSGLGKVFHFLKRWM
ncbi:MAG: hypothetical protein HQM15_10600 [Deltaproteobacteria bacterium]|nr:hypothetical protein [Deltaproteobacteria bacterium]